MNTFLLADLAASESGYFGNCAGNYFGHYRDIVMLYDSFMPKQRYGYGCNFITRHSSFGNICWVVWTDPVSASCLERNDRSPMACG